MMYEGPFPTGFYRALHGLVHAEFRSARAARTRSLRSRGERWRWGMAVPWHRLRLEWWARRPHEALSVRGSGLSPEAARRPTPEEA